MDSIQKRILEEVAGLHEVPEGAYNIRANGESAGRRSTAPPIRPQTPQTPTVSIASPRNRAAPGAVPEYPFVPVVPRQSPP